MNRWNLRETSSEHQHTGHWVGLVLTLVLLVVISAAGAIVWFGLPGQIHSEGMAEVPPTTEGMVGSPQLLTNVASRRSVQATPSWLVLLIAGFTIIQTIPLFIALRRARQPLTAQAMRKISFLCETPMYLGLLGSLLGVCLTQYISGSLAAPLAYLSTISGILLYLFAKFTIWLALPDENASGLE